MQIFLIYDNKKFRFEYNNNENPRLQVAYLFSKLPKADPIDEEKEYILIWEDEVFKKEDIIDMQIYNNRELVFIFFKKNLLKITENEEDQTVKDSKKKQKSSNDNMTMAQMIKKLTNAKEEIKPIQRKRNISDQNLVEANSHRRIYIDPSVLEEYDIDSDYGFGDDYDEDYDSDLIMFDRDNFDQMVLDESENSASDMDVSSGNFEVNLDNLSQLVAMGFNPEISELALIRCLNRIDLAIEFLMVIT